MWCSHPIFRTAKLLLLNAYSTFSQLVMGRIGMDSVTIKHKVARVGWTRDLTATAQKRLGVRVWFWRREAGT